MCRYLRYHPEMALNGKDPRRIWSYRLAARRDAVLDWESKERRLSNARLVSALAAAAFVAAAFTSEAFPRWLILAPAAAFLALVVLHDRTIRARKDAQRRVDFYHAGEVRCGDTWPGTGLAGAAFRTADHPYADDLDLFGKGSVFELLALTRTSVGAECLARRLKEPADTATVRARQEAVRELADEAHLELLEDLASFGVAVAGMSRLEKVLAWGNQEPVTIPAWAGPAAIVLGVVTYGAGVAALAGRGYQWLSLAVAVQALFLARPARWARPTLRESEEPARDLLAVAGLLHRLETAELRSSFLRSLQAELMERGQAPSAALAELGRLGATAESLNNGVFALLAWLALYPVHLARRIEKWRVENGRHFATWLRVAGEFEATASLAAYAYLHPDDIYPEIVAEGPLFEGNGIAHPLLGKHAVRNEVQLDETQRVLLISGSNMSGKSTLLRTVGVNVVLALAGAPVRAESLRLSTLQIGASMRISDSLQAGTSHFYAEILRLRQLVALSETEMPVLFLVDEILHGTNSHDRLIGAEAVVRALLERGAVGMVTTHDLALARMADDPAIHAMNVHFVDHLEDGKMEFDYRLHAGVVTKSNALELMRSIGLEV
jgi:hypothetical protein